MDHAPDVSHSFDRHSLDTMYLKTHAAHHAETALSAEEGAAATPFSLAFAVVFFSLMASFAVLASVASRLEYRAKKPVITGDSASSRFRQENIF